MSKGLQNSNGIKMNDTGNCNLCGKNSDTKCERCGDFYCSEVCQQQDWKSHRYICLPMPKLVKTGQSSTSKNHNYKNGLERQVTGQSSNSENHYNKNGLERQVTGQSSHSEAKEKQKFLNKNANRIINGSCVVLTGFRLSNICFVHSTNPTTIQEYNKVLDEINEFGKKSPTISEDLKTNAYVLTLRNEKWCRAQVLNKGINDFLVWFLDFGNTMYKPLSEMRKYATHIANLPCFVHKIQLKNVPNNRGKAIASLNQYTNKEYKIIYCEQDKFELFHWGTNNSLNRLIIDFYKNNKVNENDRDDLSVVSVLSHAGSVGKVESEKKDSGINSKENMHTITNVKDSCLKIKCPTTTEEKSSTDKAKPMPRQIQKPCLEPPFEIIPLNENEKNFKIMIMDNSYIASGFIGCLLVKDYGNLKDVSAFLKEYPVGDEPYKPKFNEYCLAYYENHWYRAKVVEILSEDLFLVSYIDFTNEKEVSSKYIRRYPMSLNLPCCTTLCAIDGLPEDMSAELKHFLEEYCSSFKCLNVDSVQILGDIRYIKCNEMLTQLRDSKLL